MGEFSEAARLKSIATRKRKAKTRQTTVSEWFWNYVEKNEGCWWWRGSIALNGYGRTFMNGRWHYAHRLAWQIAHGVVPAGMYICHSCDNPGCVRPDHLFLGTPADNHHDARSKGRLRSNPPTGARHWAHQHPERVRRGEANNKAKLTEAQVRELVKAHRNGSSQTELARQYGIRQSSVWQILAGHTWKHVTGGKSCL